VRGERSFAVKLGLGIFCGLRGAKLWFVGMRKGTERVPEAHDRALAANGRLFKTLARDLDGSEPLGLRVPAFRLPASVYDSKPGEYLSESAWTSAILGVYGVPFYADFSRRAGAPVLLGGMEVVDRLSDDELDELFRGRVFADGPAALRLAARGRTAALGCTPVADARAFNIEQLPDGIRPPINKSAHVPALTQLAPDAVACSELRYSPAGASSDAEVVAAGSVCRTNANGGVTFTASFDAAYPYTAQNLRRKAWLVRALRRLDSSFPVVCENDEPNLTLARRGADGRTYAFTLNVSYDDVEALRYSTAKPMAGAEILEADGEWHPAGAVCSDGIWTIRRHLPCMAFAVVRW